MFAQQKDQQENQRRCEDDYSGEKMLPDGWRPFFRQREHQDDQRYSEWHSGWFDGDGEAREQSGQRDWPELLRSHPSEEKCERGEEKNRDGEIALAGLGDAVGAVKDCKDSGCDEAGQPVNLSRHGYHADADGCEQGEVEGAPCGVAASEYVKNKPVDEIGAGHVDVHDVAIGSEAVPHENDDVADERGVSNQRPVARGYHECGDEQS